MEFKQEFKYYPKVFFLDLLTKHEGGLILTGDRSSGDK